MSNKNSDIYREQKKQYYSQPEILLSIKDKINWLCEASEFYETWKNSVYWTFELLCFTLETPQGQEMYKKLLNHIEPHCPDIAEKYREVFYKHIS